MAAVSRSTFPTDVVLSYLHPDDLKPKDLRTYLLPHLFAETVRGTLMTVITPSTAPAAAAAKPISVSKKAPKKSLRSVELFQPYIDGHIAASLRFKEELSQKRHCEQIGLSIIEGMERCRTKDHVIFFAPSFNEVQSGALQRVVTNFVRVTLISFSDELLKMCKYSLPEGLRGKVRLLKCDLTHSHGFIDQMKGEVESWLQETPTLRTDGRALADRIRTRLTPQYQRIATPGFHSILSNLPPANYVITANLASDCATVYFEMLTEQFPVLNSLESSPQQVQTPFYMTARTSIMIRHLLDLAILAAPHSTVCLIDTVHQRKVTARFGIPLYHYSFCQLVNILFTQIQGRKWDWPQRGTFKGKSVDDTFDVDCAYLTPRSPAELPPVDQLIPMAMKPSAKVEITDRLMLAYQAAAAEVAAAKA